MKEKRLKRKRLKLNKETLRDLKSVRNQDLAAARGGIFPTTFCFTLFDTCGCDEEEGSVRGNSCN